MSTTAVTDCSRDMSQRPSSPSHLPTQGLVSVALSNLGVMSQMLANANNPCAGVSCGVYGTCVAGVCRCAPGSGYTGPYCNVTVPPVDAVLSPWSSWSPCSASCGGGVAVRTRTCAPPMFGGAPCPPPMVPSGGGGGATPNPLVYNASVCNVQPCGAVPVPGNYSEWSEWSECSASCPGSVQGYFVGNRTRSRTCTNPPPSPGLNCSSLGPAVDVGQWVAWLAVNERVVLDF